MFREGSRGCCDHILAAKQPTLHADMEYLGYERVHSLLVQQIAQYGTGLAEQIHDGLLQKFVMPREAQDSIVRCASLCLTL